MARSSASSRATSSTGPTLWPHQQQTKSFFECRAGGFDLSDPGTGKTRAHIEVYRARKKRGRLLVLCPMTLMAAAWGMDFERFAPELTVSFAYAANREQAFALDTDVVVLNIDGVKWLADKANTKYLAGFSDLIVDEFTAYKNPTSQRSKAIAAISKWFDRKYLLSGTPTPNSVMELWHPALIVDGGKRLGTSYYKLRNTVQTPTQIGPSAQHLQWTDKPGAAQAIDELLSDITIRHAFEDVMTHVPPNHRDTKVFDLNKKTRAIYDKMENDCVIALQDKVVSAVHAASLRTKLLQIASGAVYGGDEEGEYQVVDRQRYELIADLVEERGHSVVFFNWRHQRDELSAEFKSRKLAFAVIDGTTPQRDRDTIVRDYQDGVYQTVLLHPRTGAHGITLTRGDTTILASPIYEADLLKQAMHRIYRGDQNKVTNTILVQAKDTVEELVYARLLEKEGRMLDLLDLVKQRRKA